MPEKLAHDLKCSVYWYFCDEAYHVETYRDDRLSTRDLGNVLNKVSGVFHAVLDSGFHPVGWTAFQLLVSWAFQQAANLYCVVELIDDYCRI